MTMKSKPYPKSVYLDLFRKFKERFNLKSTQNEVNFFEIDTQQRLYWATNKLKYLEYSVVDGKRVPSYKRDKQYSEMADYIENMNRLFKEKNVGIKAYLNVMGDTTMLDLSNACIYEPKIIKD